jgi:hypothetical protein
LVTSFRAGRTAGNAGFSPVYLCVAFMANLRACAGLKPGFQTSRLKAALRGDVG